MTIEKIAARRQFNLAVATAKTAIRVVDVQAAAVAAKSSDIDDLRSATPGQILAYRTNLAGRISGPGEAVKAINSIAHDLKKSHYKSDEMIDVAKRRADDLAKAASYLEGKTEELPGDDAMASTVKFLREASKMGVGGVDVFLIAKRLRSAAHNGSEIIKDDEGYRRVKRAGYVASANQRARLADTFAKVFPADVTLKRRAVRLASFKGKLQADYNAKFLAPLAAEKKLRGIK